MACVDCMYVLIITYIIIFSPIHWIGHWNLLYQKSYVVAPANFMSSCSSLLVQVRKQWCRLLKSTFDTHKLPQSDPFLIPKPRICYCDLAWKNVIIFYLVVGIIMVLFTSKLSFYLNVSPIDYGSSTKGK